MQQDSYNQFVERSSKELLDIPDHLMSFLSGIAFLQLGPHFFNKVREGRAEFGVAPARIYDDISRACLRIRPRVERRFQLWIVRRLKRSAIIARYMKSGVSAALKDGKLRKKYLNESNATTLVSMRAKANGEPPRISIVVLSFNRLSYLKNTIPAILRTVAKEQCEIIVVDNGSNDGSAEYIQAAHARGAISKAVLLKKNHGISAGYNYGFAVADDRSEYVMKLDSDIVLISPGALDSTISFLSANPDVGFAALNQVNHPAFRLLPESRVDGRYVMDFGGWPCGSAMVIPKRVLKEVGCFVEDAELKYVPDDINYYSRVSRKGYQVVILRDVRAYHQAHLDQSLYRKYSFAKPLAKSASLALRLACEYDRGDRDITLTYPKYRDLKMPPNGLMIE